MVFKSSLYQMRKKMKCVYFNLMPNDWNPNTLEGHSTAMLDALFAIDNQELFKMIKYSYSNWEVEWQK